ncbi:MAG: hypothetical protein KC912_05065 [Proteobacteria bacterium]|nr:hypothetical protein [Pseudomonadota bacterium]
MGEAAAGSLYKAAAGALGIAVLSWCCNPCFVFSFAAIGASSNVFRLANQLEISLDQDYPRQAGNLSKAVALIAGLIAVLGILMNVLGSVLRIGQALN